jgi:hypothetical protein
MKNEHVLDYTHMTRAESEIIRAQIVILQALQSLIPRAATSFVSEEIDSKLEDLTDFHYNGKYRDDADNGGIIYADTRR